MKKSELREIIRSEIKLMLNEGVPIWFSNMSTDQKKQYVKDHPLSAMSKFSNSKTTTVTDTTKQIGTPSFNINLISDRIISLSSDFFIVSSLKI